MNYIINENEKNLDDINKIYKKFDELNINNTINNK